MEEMVEHVVILVVVVEHMVFIVLATLVKEVTLVD